MTNPLRSGAFRFALAMTALFTAGTIALLLMVEQAVTSYATEVAQDSITTEAAVLADEARVADRQQIIGSVIRRENAVREHQLRYLLVDQHGRYLAGSLPARIAHYGWKTVDLAGSEAGADPNDGKAALLTFGTRLHGNMVLVVASDTSDLAELRQSLGTAAIVFGLVIGALALFGGLIVGSMFLRRLGRVNVSVERIMQGSFAERLPTIGMSPEFVELSTNLNAMLSRIERLIEGMRQVSTDIAHDLRTPLTRLRQRLEEMHEADPATVSKEQIDGALEQTDQILTVFRALLRISALEAGAGQQHLEQADISALLVGLHQAYQPVTEDEQRHLTSRIEPDIRSRIDPDLLTQAVTNLIENAILHTPVGSTIQIALERRPSGFSIIVADNGLGIPEAKRAQVLQRFYRLDSSRGTPGAGLGLALVAAIAALHNASLTLADNSPGLRVEIAFEQR